MVDVNFNVFVSFWNNLESIESQIRRTFLKFISTITNNFIMEIVKKHNTICFCYVSYTCIHIHVSYAVIRTYHGWK